MFNIEGRNALLHSRSSSQVFLDKMREFELLILEERKYLSQAHRNLVETKYPQWVCELVISRSKERLNEATQQYKRFSYYHSVSLGHKMNNDYDLEVLKQVDPQIFLGKPAWSTNKTLTYKCPFHNEKTASFVWYLKNNSGYCFGCQKSVDIIALVQQLHNIDFLTALSEIKAII